MQPRLREDRAKVGANDADISELKEKIAEMDAQIAALKSTQPRPSSQPKRPRVETMNAKIAKLKDRNNDDGEDDEVVVDDDDDDYDDDSKRGSSPRHAANAGLRPSRMAEKTLRQPSLPLGRPQVEKTLTQSSSQLEPPQVEKMDTKVANQMTRNIDGDDDDDVGSVVIDDDDDDDVRGPSSQYALKTAIKKKDAEIARLKVANANKR